MDNNVLTMIGCSAALLSLLWCSYNLHSKLARLPGSRVAHAKVTNRSALPSMVLPEATRV